MSTNESKVENKKLISKIADAKTWLMTSGWWKTDKGLLAIAVTLGIFSGLMSHIRDYLHDQDQAERYRMKSVFVARVDIKAGDVLSKSQLALRSVLATSVSSNMISEKNISLALGRSTNIDLKANDPIFISNISQIGEMRHIAAQIPAGKRLFSLTISDIATGNGFIKPNDHVDIIAQLDLPQRGKTSVILMQDVTLVSVGTTTALNEEGDVARTATSVSFFIEAKDAEILAYANERGKFSLSLRNPSDVSVVNSSKGVDVDDFLDNELLQRASGGSALKVLENGVKVDAKKKG